MPIVSVEKKFQIVIPQDLRKLVRVKVGDLLEAKADRSKITLNAEVARRSRDR
jgi:AbrB family looped-hinge helix DNA binding protein